MPDSDPPPIPPASDNPVVDSAAADIDALLNQAEQLTQQAADEIGAEPPAVRGDKAVDLDRPPIGTTHLDDQLDEVASLVAQAGAEAGAAAAHTDDSIPPSPPIADADRSASLSRPTTDVDESAQPSTRPAEAIAADASAGGDDPPTTDELPTDIASAPPGASDDIPVGGHVDDMLAEIIDQAAATNPSAVAVELAVTQESNERTLATEAAPPLESSESESPVDAASAEALPEFVDEKPAPSPVTEVSAEPSPTAESTIGTQCNPPEDPPPPRPPRFRALTSAFTSAISAAVGRPLALLNRPFARASDESRLIAGVLGFATLLAAAAIWFLPRILQLPAHPAAHSDHPATRPSAAAAHQQKAPAAHDAKPVAAHDKTPSAHTSESPARVPPAAHVPSHD